MRPFLILVLDDMQAYLFLESTLFHAENLRHEITHANNHNLIVRNLYQLRLIDENAILITLVSESPFGDHTMYKKNLTMAMGRAIASSLLGVTPTIHAGEHVFEISSIDQTQQLAAAANDKTGETCTNTKIRQTQYASADDKR